MRHFQGVYGGYMETCEKCARDQERWEPAGTYCRKCEYRKADCERRNCAYSM